MQEGQIFRKGASWFVRFRELRLLLRSGKPGWRQVCKRLGPFDKKCGSRRAVAPLASKILAPVNAGTLRPESRQRLRDFVEYVYVPHCKEHQRPSTPNRLLKNRVSAL